MRGIWQDIRSGGWSAWLLLTLILLLLAVPTITYPLGRDQGEFATIGRGILEGKVPYVDLWNPKPPAIFYTYALMMRLFGDSIAALRAIDLLLLPIMTAALYQIGKRISSRSTGLWAALLFGVFYFTETFWTLTQNDGIATVPMTLAVLGVFALLDVRDKSTYAAYRRWGFAFITGALCALVLWFKYPFIFFVIALVVSYLTVRRQLVWGEILSFIIGGLLIGLGGIAWMVNIGAWDALWESARVTAGYTAQGYDSVVFLADMRNYVGWRIRHWGVLWVFVGLWLVLIPFHSDDFAQNYTNSSESLVTDRLRWRIIIGWLLGTAVAMLVQAKGYDYHWLPMLPSFTLMGAETIHVIVTRLRRQWSSSVTEYVVVGSIVFFLLGLLTLQTWGGTITYLTGQTTQSEYYAQFQGGEVNAAESLAISNYLREKTTAGDSLFIWGFRPEVYTMSNMRPAARFIFQFPLVANWYPVEWQQQTVDTLWASLPPYVLVVKGDFMPWVTGQDADSNTLLQSYTELNNWLIFNYDLETEIGNFIVWRRKP